MGGTEAKKEGVKGGKGSLARLSRHHLQIGELCPFYLFSSVSDINHLHSQLLFLAFRYLNKYSKTGVLEGNVITK